MVGVQPLELRIRELEEQRERRARNIAETRRAVREMNLACWQLDGIEDETGRMRYAIFPSIKERI